MAKQEKDTLYVIAATYDDVDAAVADYEAVKVLYREVKSSHDFDASVIAKDEDGKVRIVKKHEQPTRHGAVSGSAGAWPWVSPRPCSRRSASAWLPPGLVVRPSVPWPGTPAVGCHGAT